MYRKSIFAISFIFLVTACGGLDRSTVIQDPGTGDGGDSTETVSDQESVIPTTGGAAQSPDGLFSIVMGPFVFDQTVTMTIEKLEAPISEADAHLMGTYRVSYLPEEAVLSASANFRVQFKVDETTLEEVGVDNMRIAVRASDSEAEEGLYDSENNANFDENKAVVWSSSTQLGDFGLLDRSSADPGACECNTDETCDEACLCDPDCILDDPADASDPSVSSDDPSDPSASSDPSDVGPIECDETQWACADGEQCVPLSAYCNGLPQCNDGSDETDIGCSGGGGTTGPAADTLEPDSSFSEASTYVFGEPQSHTLPIGDEDYVLFTLETRQDVTISTGGGSGDTILYLYTENYSLITEDDQGGINSFS
ncbi:MAG: hypothetical protein HOK28_11845, partial [Deltaproteobacteria bacterium]|nr:hypothetical protein [Deltaproteobacteria bacterium]